MDSPAQTNLPSTFPVFDKWRILNTARDYCPALWEVAPVARESLLVSAAVHRWSTYYQYAGSVLPWIEYAKWLFANLDSETVGWSG